MAPDATATAVFLHIPKSAGTTLNRVIDLQYGEDEVFSILETVSPQSGTIADFGRLPARKRASARLIRGHFAYGIHELLPQPATYFTVLRNPTDRVVSHYHHALRAPDHNLHRYVKGLSLAEVLARQSHVDKAFDNFQTRLLSGVWNTLPFGACSEETLQIAKTNLRRHFAVVGVMKRFDELLLLLQEQFGWRFVYYARHNVRASHDPLPAVSPQALALICEHNSLDQELYEFAAELCARQIAEAGEEFQERLRRFRRANRLVAPGLRLYWKARQISVRSMVKQRFGRLDFRARRRGVQ